MIEPIEIKQYEVSKHWIYKVKDGKLLESKIVEDSEYKKLLKTKEWFDTPAIKTKAVTKDGTKG